MAGLLSCELFLSAMSVVVLKTGTCAGWPSLGVEFGGIAVQSGLRQTVGRLGRRRKFLQQKEHVGLCPSPLLGANTCAGWGGEERGGEAEGEAGSLIGRVNWRRDSHFHR